MGRDPFPTLTKLLCSNQPPLWDITAPLAERKKQIKAALRRAKREHNLHLKDDGVSLIDTGVLLGAVNLLEGLLEAAEE